MNILNSPTTISQSNIFPKYPENFGMVAIEAAAHGLPTVAFATGGIVDAVKDGVSGYLVESNNYIKLSEKIVFLLENQLFKDSTREFSRAFEWDNFGRKICKTVNTIFSS